MSKTGPKTKIIHTPSPTTAAKPKPTKTYDASVMEASADWNYNTHPSANTNDYPNEIHVDNRPAKNYHNSQTSTIHNNQVPTMSNQMSYDTVLDSKNEITSMVLQYMSSLPMEVAMESGLIECSEGFTRPICKAIPMWNNNRPFDEWCSVLCPTGVCPAAICSCTCPTTTQQYQNNADYKPGPTIKCRSMTAWGDTSMDQWCTSTCNSNPDNCPSDHCYCDGL